MKYDKDKYKVLDWKSPLVIHWILNPVLVINDLILGQTIPKVMLIERKNNKPIYKRYLVPCPHCETIHSGIKWSLQNKTGFRNWIGYYCDNCKELIPVQRNLTSLIILIVTFPIWGWFRKSLKQKWLIKQPERFKDIKLEIPEVKSTTKKWLKSGLIWGLFMFTAMQIVYPLIENEEITKESILIGFPISIIAGLGLGYTNKLWMNKMLK